MKLVFVFVLGFCFFGVGSVIPTLFSNGNEENPYQDNRLSLYRAGYLGLSHSPVIAPIVKSVIETPIPTKSLTFPSDAGLGSLWKSTIPVRDRGVLHSLTHHNPYDEEKTFSALIFGNLLTHRTFIFKDILNASVISGAVGNTEIIDEIGNISFAQEQLGVLLHGYYEYKNIGFSVDLPIQAVVTHPWAPSSTLKMIREMPGDETYFTPAQKDEIKKQISELGWVAGLGDLKLGVRVNNFLCNDRFFWCFGATLVLPLQSSKVPEKALSFNPIVDNFNPALSDLLFDESERLKYVKNLISLVRGLGANPSLGQKSYGVGLNAGVQVKIHPTCTAYARVGADYIMPVSEFRIIHRYLDVGNTVLAVEPGEYLVKSSRGIILRATGGFDQKMSKNITFGLGGDLFFQNKESIATVFTEDENSGKLFFGKDNECLRAAEMAQVAQTVIYGQITKKLAIRGGRAQLSLRGAGTLDASGIGKLWNIGVCFSSTF